MNRRTAAIVATLVLGGVVAVFVVARADGPTPTPTRAECLIGGERPCSTDVEVGKPYRFQVLHCGLIWVVDFDQSYWDVDVGSMTEEENGRFGINSDEGTMTLEKADVAVYRSDRGGDATLRRHTDSPRTPFLCG